MKEIKEEEIKKQAKEIIDKFMSALSKIKEPELKFVERKEFERDEREKEAEQADSEFKQIMFKNAPNKNKDNIIAEKGKWK